MLNELSLKPWSVKISFLLGLSVLIIVLGYEILIQDRITQINLLKNQEATLKVSFENKQGQLYHLPAYRAQVHSLRGHLDLVLKQRLEKNQIPGLLEDISKTGSALGLQFVLFAPQPEVISDFYIELPIKIAVVGSYFQLAAFLSRIDQMDRMLTLYDLTIEKHTSVDHQTVSGDKLMMNITVSLYRYLT